MDKELHARLLDGLGSRYGEVIGGEVLSKVLGFSSLAAMRQGIRRETLKIPIFFIPGRRGRFALTADVVAWLVECRARADHQKLK